MHTKDAGDIAEQFMIAHCLKRGWSVSKPIGDNQRYDMVLDRGDGKLLKIQTKKGTLINGVIVIYTRSSGYRFDGEGKRILFNENYSINDVDFIGSYCNETNKCYLIENKEKSNIYLRVEPVKNNQTKNVRYAKDFEI